MIMRINWKKFVVSVAIPLLVGGLSALISRSDMGIYDSIEQPPLSPPSWLFGVVWTILYFLMGVSLYLIWDKNIPSYKKQTSYWAFGIQLFLNFLWAPIFFITQQFLLSLILLILIILATVLMIVSFWQISKPAALIQIPYLVWLCFAAYLNFGIYLLNR